MSDSLITPIVMPKWGLAMKEGKLAAWLAEEGSDVAAGDELLEVETEKITNVVETADGGTLRRKVGAEGSVYPVKTLLGVMAPSEVSDADIDAFIAGYEVPAGEDDEDEEAAQQTAFIETPSGRLRYASKGEEGGETVVLIHGFGGDLDNWLFNIDALAEWASVHALDLPGHGQSSKALDPPGLDALADAALQLMDALEIEAAHLVGHSMGGSIAATIAQKVPDRTTSLTLISPAGLGEEINSAYIDGFVKGATRRELKPVLQDLFADPQLASRQMVDDLLKYKRLDGVTDVLTALAASQFADGRQQTRVADALSAMDLPIQVIWGAEDKVIPASHANAVSGAKVEVIDGAGHMVQMEEASAVNALIKSHIAG